MDTPAPIDVSRLKSILGKAKHVMKATDQMFPEKKLSQISESQRGLAGTPATSAPIYDERDEREPNYGEDHSGYLTEAPIHQPKDYTVESVMRSNLPPSIKQAMIDKHIPKITSMPSKFSLDGLEDLVDKKPNRSQPIREAQRPRQVDSDMLTISKSELNEMIENKVNEMIAKLYTKTISEQAIKKTINTLISEGKISTKKK